MRHATITEQWATATPTGRWHRIPAWRWTINGWSRAACGVIVRADHPSGWPLGSACARCSKPASNTRRWGTVGGSDPAPRGTP